MKAWIVKWNWIGDHAKVEQPVVAVLSARLSSEMVRQHVQMLYASTNYTLAEQLSFARYNKPATPPYEAEFERIGGVPWGGFITCGHNPFLEAFKAEDVRVADNEFGLSWSTKGLDKGRARVAKLQQQLKE